MKTDGKGRLVSVLILIAAPVFFFVFPRAIVRAFGMESPWPSYFYLYGNGLIVFLIGVLIILRYRACQLGRGRDTFWFIVLFVGYLFFASLHAIWIWAALHYPVKGVL